MGMVPKHYLCSEIWGRESSVRPSWSGRLDIWQNLSCNLDENFQHVTPIKNRESFCVLDGEKR